MTESVTAWVAIGLSIVAILISLFALVWSYQLPWWVNESNYDPERTRDWSVRMVNRGKGDAINVKLIVWVKGGTWMSTTVYHMADIDMRRVRYQLTWEQHPFPWWTHKKWIKPTDKTKPNEEDYDLWQSIY